MNSSENSTSEAASNIGIIALPRSSSTFTFRCLQRLVDYTPVSVIHRYLHRPTLPEADIELAEKLMANESPFIFREHLALNENTLLFLQRTKIRPIVLTRRLDDAIVSLSEEWARQWQIGEAHVKQDGFHLQFCGAIPYPFVSAFLESGESQRLQMVINAALPWLSHFVQGWSWYLRRSPDFGILIDYDEILTDANAAMARAVSHLGLSFTERQIEEAARAVLADRQLSNFHIGKSGRGSDALSLSQRAQIAAAQLR